MPIRRWRLFHVGHDVVPMGGHILFVEKILVLRHFFLLDFELVPLVKIWLVPASH